MDKSLTESHHIWATGLDTRKDAEILKILLQSQQMSLGDLSDVFDEIAHGSELMAKAIISKASLIYVGAGSSGLMAHADAIELGGTFGIDSAQIRILIAGGLPSDSRMPGSVEDDSVAARRDAKIISAGDTVIAISASGYTPYTVTIAQIAHECGANLISIANNANAPIHEYSNVAIPLNTPSEVIAGSTRMGSATAQKVVLNLMSTLMGIRLGHIYDGMMVNVIADNDKLRNRAIGIVTRITGVSEEAALDHLNVAGIRLKPAVLLASGASSLSLAEEILEQNNGHLRASLARICNQE